jgi:hypothetical protein
MVRVYPAISANKVLLQKVVCNGHLGAIVGQRDAGSNKGPGGTPGPVGALQFIKSYDSFVKEIELYIKPEYNYALQKLKDTDPHDLVRPDTYFLGYSHMRGLVWSEFVDNAEKYKK